MSPDESSPRNVGGLEAVAAGEQTPPGLVMPAAQSSAAAGGLISTADALLAAKLESLAEFAAGAGHEINNPLAVISGRAQLLLRDEKDPERRRDLAIIHMQAMRVHEMIADMMLFARPPLPKPAKCDLSAVVDRTIEGLRNKATPLDLTIERAGSREPTEAEVDAEQIGIAVRALIDNGLNAMRPGGRVEVELDVVEDEALQCDAIEITIRDEGPGIPAAEREHLFDPFFSGRQAGRGLGMGLSKAWRIVTNHGGTIEVDPQSAAAAPANDVAQETTRRGATFVVRLPASPSGQRL